MSIHNSIKLTEAEITNALAEGITIRRASQILNVTERTFKKEALKYDLYKPAKHSCKKIPLADILNGLHPQYQTSHILPRLVKEGIRKYECSCCGITEWQGKRIGLELDHIDGNNSNHSLDNLRALCPNCHSQTDTYRSKKIKFLRLQKEDRGAGR